MELNKVYEEILDIVKNFLFPKGIRGFIEEMYRNNKGLEEIEIEVSVECSKMYIFLKNKNIIPNKPNFYEGNRVMTLTELFKFEIYKELYKFEISKKGEISFLEKYFYLTAYNYLFVLRLGEYKVSNINELKHEILEYARKNHFLQALIDLIDEIYGQSTIYQKIMYAIDGVYYNDDEAFNRYKLLQDSQFDGGTLVEQKQK